jgi:hypothetical protein
MRRTFCIGGRAWLEAPGYDELVYYPRDVRSGNRAYSQFPPPPIGMLRQAGPDAGFLEEVAHDRGATISLTFEPSAHSPRA